MMSMHVRRQAVCLGAGIVMAGAALIAQDHPRRDLKVVAAADFKRYTHSAGTYSIEHPSDWQAHEQPTRTNIGSESGLVPGERGGFRTVYGAIIAVTEDPGPAAGGTSLAESTKAVVDTILKRNAHQSLREPVVEDGVLGGSPAYRAVTYGISPVTGKSERVEILCRRAAGAQVLYIIFVSPEESYQELKPAFTRMRNSFAMPGTNR